MVRGSEPGAPALLRLWPKLLVTSALAAIVTALVLWGMSSDFIRLYLR